MLTRGVMKACKVPQDDISGKDHNPTIVDPPVM